MKEFTFDEMINLPINNRFYIWQNNDLQEYKKKEVITSSDGWVMIVGIPLGKKFSPSVFNNTYRFYSDYDIQFVVEKSKINITALSLFNIFN